MYIFKSIRDLWAPVDLDYTGYVVRSLFAFFFSPSEAPETSPNEWITTESSFFGGGGDELDELILLNCSMSCTKQR